MSLALNSLDCFLFTSNSSNSSMLLFLLFPNGVLLGRDSDWRLFLRISTCFIILSNPDKTFWFNIGANSDRRIFFIVSSTTSQSSLSGQRSTLRWSFFCQITFITTLLDFNFCRIRTGLIDIWRGPLIKTLFSTFFPRHKLIGKHTKFQT